MAALSEATTAVAAGTAASVASTCPLVTFWPARTEIVATWPVRAKLRSMTPLNGPGDGEGPTIEKLGRAVRPVRSGTSSSRFTANGQLPTWAGILRSWAPGACR